MLIVYSSEFNYLFPRLLCLFFQIIGPPHLNDGFRRGVIYSQISVADFKERAALSFYFSPSSCNYFSRSTHTSHLNCLFFHYRQSKLVSTVNRMWETSLIKVLTHSLPVKRLLSCLVGIIALLLTLLLNLLLIDIYKWLHLAVAMPLPSIGNRLSLSRRQALDPIWQIG